MRRYFLGYIICFLAGMFLAYLTTCNHKADGSILNQSQNDTTAYKIRVDTFNLTHVQYKQSPTKIIEHTTLQYVKDTLAPALGIAVKQIDELTRIKASLEGQIKYYERRLDEQGQQITVWQSKYMQAKLNADSSLSYRYNAIIDIASYNKQKNIISKPIHYVDISSPDSNFMVNGVQKYSRPVTFPKGHIDMGIDASLMYIKPSFNGVGRVYMELNPDGRIRPYVHGGLFLYNKELFPFYGGGLKYQILKF